ncbi:hypothetical protein Cgig2_026783 [Carnegiea gigantea]|uniref:Uncharacterized protein n=1 Tax=Carnegiea gigantea TaxID=171969 RepID=A0A9Q1JLW1_9CARY|nr:hypothetical protein Cgig2_026783 [Carnegiea gigantea]
MEREGESERNQTTEEANQLLRSTKKMKRGTAGNSNEVADREDVEIMEIVVGSPHVPDTAPVNPQTRGRLRASYRDTLQRNNPNLEFETRENPIWEDDGFDEESRENDARRVHQLSNNHDPRVELASSDAQDQGPRFRALANLDLNIEMDPALEREDVQGDKEEDLFHMEGTGFRREINRDCYAESRTEMATAFRGPTSSHSQVGPIASGTVDPRTTHGPGHSFSIQHGSPAQSNMQHTTIGGGPLCRTSGRGLTNHYRYPVGDTSLVGVPPDKNRSLGRESNESRQLAILDGSNQSPEVGGCYNAGHGTREAMRRCESGSSQ